ncbi:four and a half LIM domains protein 2-like [Styela clava]|uniref:four and a half LIM domains protein 2-like n=1 Tax=Styela clava TaxID=7725 RepID=UPI00193ACDCE|nr:four and a half LIM domains protein 2-like [Styela clava]
MSSRGPQCFGCEVSLAGKQYLLQDSNKYCVNCFESYYCNPCNTCGKVIGTDCRDVTYKDQHYHELCFTCSVCDNPLADTSFTNRDGKFVCVSCYDDKFAPKCHECGKKFKAGTRRMEYGGLQYHEACFRCATCGRSIGTKSFVKRDGGVHCENCFESNIASKCVKCSKPIKTSGVTYRDDAYHGKCFICAGCDVCLANEKFTSHDDQPFCLKCHVDKFSKKCYKCQKPITGLGGGKMISFEDLGWHVDCFTCRTCSTALEGQGFVMLEDDTFCAGCADAIEVN